MSNTITEQAFQPAIDPTAATVQQMFGQVLSQCIQSGAVEQAITKYVDKLIDDAAKDVFQSYNDVGKALKEQFAKAIMPRLESIADLPTYHEFVTNRLKLATQQFYDTRLAQVLEKEMQELLTEVPEQITLSWLVEQVVNSVKEDNYEGNITLIIRPTFDFSDTSMSVFIDKHEGRSERDCQYDMHLSLDKDSKKWSIIGISINGKKPGDKLCMGRMYNFDKIIFNIFAMKGLVDLDCGTDADDYDTSWCND